MASAGMLNCVCIDSDLMNLPGEVRVTVFIPEHFRVQVPTLVAGVVVIAGIACLAGGHSQSATGTNSFLRHCHKTKITLSTHSRIATTTMDVVRWFERFLCATSAFSASLR